VATFYDANGGFITTSDALIDYNPILPGQTSPFKVMKTENPAMKKASVEFKYLMGAPSIPESNKEVGQREAGAIRRGEVSHTQDKRTSNPPVFSWGLPRVLSARQGSSGSSGLMPGVPSELLLQKVLVDK